MIELLMITGITFQNFRLSKYFSLSELGQAEKKQKRKKVCGRDQSLPPGGKRNCGSRRTKNEKRSLKMSENDIL